MLTRDHFIWTLLALGGAAGFVATHFEKFPFISHDYQGTVELAAFLCTVIGAKAGMSPLPKSGSPDQQVLMGKILGL